MVQNILQTRNFTYYYYHLKVLRNDVNIRIQVQHMWYQTVSSRRNGTLQGDLPLVQKKDKPKQVTNNYHPNLLSSILKSFYMTSLYYAVSQELRLVQLQERQKACHERKSVASV